MPIDRSFIEKNRAATERIRAFAQRSEEELRHPVGEHWTVAITLAHIAFWEYRTLNILEQTELAGQLVAPEIDVVVNDLSLPLWAILPPKQTAQLAVELAEKLDQRLANFPTDLLEQVHDRNERWVVRALHRNEHLDEAESALQK